MYRAAVIGDRDSIYGFAALGLDEAMTRVIAIVVQPGVEFDHTQIIHYQPEAAKALSAWIEGTPMVYEAHSTDYQSRQAYRALVRDHYAILKVGPALTFALVSFSVAALPALWRLVRGPAAQDRVLALDFLYLLGMLVTLVLGIRNGSDMYFEAALIIALTGFVSSSALAKFLLRGEVIEP